jgi:hypothetical protein
MVAISCKFIGLLVYLVIASTKGELGGIYWSYFNTYPHVNRSINGQFFLEMETGII